MILTMTDNPEKDVRTYTLRIPLGELACAPLNRFDRLLLADCDGSDRVSDKLLALETIARRIEERSTMNNSASSK